MRLKQAKKIAVVGNSASGKSYLSNEIGRKLALDVINIDKYFWLSGWKLRDPDDFRRLHDDWMKKKSWLIDGVGYWEQVETRLFAADFIIFLDVPTQRCKDQALKRMQEQKSAANEYIAAGCLYADVMERQMCLIDEFEHTWRPKIMSCLKQLAPHQFQVITSIQDLY